MEAVLLHGSFDQSISPYKSHIRTAKRIQYPLIARPCESFLPSNLQAGMALLQAPPPPFLSRSYPPYSLQQPPQPPLLPLPTATPHRSTGGRGLSCPPANRKPNSGNRTRDPSLTPKKSKSPTKSPKKEDKNSPKKKSSECVNIVTSTTITPPLGPDPRELAKDVRKVLPLISSSGNIYSKSGNNCISDANSLLSSGKAEEDQVDMFSGSVVFTISPPPSSLPLPTFSLRPKLSCNAEAAGIDTGATDNLRRLLRIR